MSRRAFDPFWLVLGLITGSYLLFWLGLLVVLVLSDYLTRGQLR